MQDQELISNWLRDNNKNIIRMVTRGGISYPVVDQNETDVCVLDIFDFADAPKRRVLHMWWSKNCVRNVIG